MPARRMARAPGSDEPRRPADAGEVTPVKLKLDENGHVVVSEGRPVYVYDDGKEVAFDAPSTVAKIGQLNAEAKSHRERAESFEKIANKLPGFAAEWDAALALAPAWLVGAAGGVRAASRWAWPSTSSCAAIRTSRRPSCRPMTRIRPCSC